MLGVGLRKVSCICQPRSNEIWHKPLRSAENNFADLSLAASNLLASTSRSTCHPTAELLSPSSTATQATGANDSHLNIATNVANSDDCANEGRLFA